MTHEVVVGQQVDKEKEAKEKTKRLVITLGAMFLLIFGCIASCLAFGALGSTVESAEPPKTAAPTQIYVPEMSTTFPTPAYLTAGAIAYHREGLTDLQKAQYDREVIGEEMQFKGQVEEVAENGTVLLNDDSPGTDFVRLRGIPDEVTISLEKGQFLEGMGTIVGVSEVIFGLLLRVEIQVTSWND